jgi:hypothetical protein
MCALFELAPMVEVNRMIENNNMNIFPLLPTNADI